MTYACQACGHVRQAGDPSLIPTLSESIKLGNCGGETGKPYRAFRLVQNAPATTAALRRFDGDTYEPDQDQRRLSKEYDAVWAVMRDGKPHTLAELSERTGYPQPGISARIRDFRKQRNGGHTVRRERVEGGLFQYTLVRNDGA